VTEVKVEKQYPSETLMRDCGQPEFNRDGSIFSDLFPYIKTLQSALAQCNNDKRALRQWRESSD